MAEFSESTNADELARRAWGRLCEHWLNHALELTGRALAVDPAHLHARQVRGVTLMRMGRPTEGLALLQAAEADGLDTAGFWLDLSVAHQRMENSAASARAWERALAHNQRLAEMPDWFRRVFVSERMFHKYKVVDYDAVANNRYGPGRGSHPELARYLAAGDDDYRAQIEAFAAHVATLADIPLIGDYASDQPFWLNSWMSPLDGIALVGMLAEHRPGRYIEIGSGMSTKFARRAIDRLQLDTRIVSIDPAPRNRIDRLVDEKIRMPFENVAESVVSLLQPGDILFFDGSHRSFPGSDVTVFFLEVLPRLRPGVVVHIHDIYLPDDYPAGHVPRLWNEQYLLACALLYGGESLEVLFPGWYASRQPSLSAEIHRRLRPGALANAYIHGMSFWLRKTAPQIAASLRSSR